VESLKHVLVLNCGSSNLKWSVLDARDQASLCSGVEPWRTALAEGDASRRGQLQLLLDALPEFDAVGHRLVHGGKRFRSATRIHAQARRDLGDLIELDPLHMQPALDVIDAVSARFPDKRQVACFDTAFHATLSAAASTYALPFEWTERWGLRRYGFHGLSVTYARQRAAELLGRDPDRMLVCHLGSGCSVTAVERGRSVDTTMGFTPLEGMVMSTRAGSIDPGLLLHLQLRCGIGRAELLQALTLRSGLLGVSGVSGDLREVQTAAASGSTRATLAYDVFILAAKRAIGSMLAVLGGIDVLVFTGGIGENDDRVRRDIVAALDFAGVYIDEASNRTARPDQDIGAADSKARVLVIAAREDLVILRETVECLQAAGSP